MNEREEKTLESKIELFVLGRLNSAYPDAVNYKGLEGLTKGKFNCFPREFIRILSRLEGNGYVKMTPERLEEFSFFSPPDRVGITAQGINYLEKLEEETKLEKKRGNTGFQQP